MNGKKRPFSVNFQHHPVIAQFFETHRDWAVGCLHQGRFTKVSSINLRSGLNCHRRFGGVPGDAFYNKQFDKCFY